MSTNDNRRPAPGLSKSRFLAGLQCLKRLYLEVYQREQMSPLDPAQRAIMEAGVRIGEVARGLRPGGLLIEYEYWRHEEAVEATKTALADPRIPALYEAAFAHDDIRVRVDILDRVDEAAFDLIEIKSATRVKDAHLPDVGVQLYVLQGCGVPVRRACVAYVNNEYVYPGGEYDLEQLFVVDDVHERLERYDLDVAASLAGMREALRSEAPLEIKPGKQCTQPYVCPFYDYCREGQPEYHVSQLPRAGHDLLITLEALGVEDIRDIPASLAGLTPLQLRARECVVGETTYIDPQVLLKLNGLEYPIHFLDFETFGLGLPVYPGTRPYEVIPFQWSNHILDRDGTLRHEEFLYTGFDDPREPFARSLLRSVGTEGSILTYSNFESIRIRELADKLPHLSESLMGLLEVRIVDLLVLVRDHCYHPDFRGSFSLKRVLPAMVSGFTYDDLDVSVGGQASAAYAEIISPDTTPERREFLVEGLREYCKRDTLAMVSLYHALLDGVRESGEC